MRRPRPYIPIKTRLKVAFRQLKEAGRNPTDFEMSMRRQYGNISKRGLLTLALKALFPNAAAQLDHDPALILRPYHWVNGYTPDANDPDWLVWREKADHQEKTTGRRPGARCTITTKGSDIGLKTKFAKLERKPRLTPKIPSRGFQKQKRKIGR